MNAVVLAVLVMLVLSAARVHVVLSLVIGAFVGGLAAGLPLADIIDPATHEVITKGVFGGDPILVQLGFTRFALRKIEAEKIEISQNDGVPA